jgi:hypothetical protein
MLEAGDVAYQSPTYGTRTACGCGVIVPVGVGKRTGVIVGLGVNVGVEDGDSPPFPRTGKSRGSDIGLQPWKLVARSKNRETVKKTPTDTFTAHHLLSRPV